MELPVKSYRQLEPTGLRRRSCNPRWMVQENLLKRRIIHEYGEPLEAEVQVYSLEEVVAAKLRADPSTDGDVQEARLESVPDTQLLRSIDECWEQRTRIGWTSRASIPCCCVRGVLFGESRSRAQTISFRTVCRPMSRLLGSSGSVRWCRDYPFRDGNQRIVTTSNVSCFCRHGSVGAMSKRTCPICRPKFLPQRSLSGPAMEG